MKIKEIQIIVMRYYNIGEKDFFSDSKLRSLVRPRQLAMTLSREFTERSLSQIGRQFHREHTTVIAAIRRYKMIEATPQKQSKRYKNEWHKDLENLRRQCQDLNQSSP